MSNSALSRAGAVQSVKDSWDRVNVALLLVRTVRCEGTRVTSVWSKSGACSGSVRGHDVNDVFVHVKEASVDVERPETMPWE